MPIAPHIPQCHHVHTNGSRCGSPAMRGRKQCFYHLRTSAKPAARPTELPSLEDGDAIQLGIAQVIRRVLLCDIEYKAAAVLLYGYKLAILNLRNTGNTPLPGSVVTVDPALDPDNAGNATEPLTLMQQPGPPVNAFGKISEADLPPVITAQPQSQPHAPQAARDDVGTPSAWSPAGRGEVAAEHGNGSECENGLREASGPEKKSASRVPSVTIGDASEAGPAREFDEDAVNRLLNEIEKRFG